MKIPERAALEMTARTIRAVAERRINQPFQLQAQYGAARISCGHLLETAKYLEQLAKRKARR